MSSALSSRGIVIRCSEKAISLLHAILNSFEIEADTEQLKSVLNLTLLIVITCRALPENLPLLVSEASDGTAEFQMEALVELPCRKAQNEPNLINR